MLSCLSTNDFSKQLKVNVTLIGQVQGCFIMFIIGNEFEHNKYFGLKSTVWIWSFLYLLIYNFKFCSFFFKSLSYTSVVIFSY